MQTERVPISTSTQITAMTRRSANCQSAPAALWPALPSNPCRPSCRTTSPFHIPQPFADDVFRLEPLGRRHNVEGLQAWPSSIKQIQQTPGFAGRGWPDRAESLEQNLLSLARHEQDFTLRRGFAYVVRDAKTSEYVGCVYFYPPRTGDFDVDVRSWVRTPRRPISTRGSTTPFAVGSVTLGHGS